MSSPSFTIAVVGAPHSGKSVLISQIYRELREMGGSFFLERACPDGEGMWSAEADQDIVKQIRYKNKFSNEFVNMKIAGIENLQKYFNVVLLDLGGLPSEENKQFLSVCTHYIFLKRDGFEQLISDWKKLLETLDIERFAELDSIWEGENRLIVSDENITGQLVRLDRENCPEETQRAIRAIALEINKLGENNGRR